MKKVWRRVLAVFMMVVLFVGILPVGTEKVKAAGNEWYWPTPSVTAITPGREYSSGHQGIDITAPLGTPVYAAKAGTVWMCGKTCDCISNLNCEHYLYANGGWWKGSGYFVVIKHDDGTWSSYNHLKANSFANGVSTGARVSQGQLLALSGTTGCSSGPHLHFAVGSGGEAYWNSTSVNNNRDAISYVYNYDATGTPTPTPTPTYTSSFPLQNNSIYKITSVLSGKVMEVSTGSSQNSKQINLWTYDNSAWMQWKAVQHSDGYSFINVHTGKALDITGGSAAEGTKVAQYDYLASDAQRFKLVDKGNGRYGMIAVCSNLAVDVYGSDKKDGALLEQYAFHGGDNQLWTFEPVGDVENTIYSSIYSDGISSTDATIHATLAYYMNVSDEGFYISTNANMSGSKKISEGLSVQSLSGISYNMNKWYGTLTAGTTYYYQFYVVSGGDEFKSEVQSFTTVSISDVEKPVVTSVVVSDVDKTGYTVTATATDNVGVTNMSFPTKQLDQGQDAWKWYQGVRQKDGSYSYRVNVSDFDNVDGVYQTVAYAYDAAGNNSADANQAGWEVRQYVDTTPPVISDVKISNIDGTGYTVTCTVTDNNEVERVVFPTWTDYNWQDDLPTDWYNDSTTRGVQNGNQFSIRINASDHNYERGKYHTHIYAYDRAGNYVYAKHTVNINNDGEIVSEAAYEGHIYQLFDDKMTWQEAKKACEDMGGHLVTITSQEEQKIVQSLLPLATTSSGYFIGGYTENGQSKWVTGEPFSYSHWIDGQPDGWDGTEAETAYVMCSDAYGKACVGWWNDIAGTTSGYGYICEFETVKIIGIDLSESSVSLNKGETKQINAIIISESGYPALVSWSSENEDIAVVKDGKITGMGAGTTKIWAECEGQRTSCTVTVAVPIERIALDSAQKSLLKGESCQLDVTVYPVDVTEAGTFIWSSSNPHVAGVNNSGKVTAYSAGTTEISVALADNANMRAVCEVTVTSCLISFETNGGTKVNAVECGTGERLSPDEEPTRQGYVFTGWYKDAACTMLWDAEKDVVSGNLTLYAGWAKYNEGLWIVDIPAQHYTGKAIKPEVCVYHDNEKLVKGKDYSVKYKNNIKANAGTNSSNVPTVIVTGKGNYTGKESATFTILQKDLKDASVSADDIFAVSNGKVQKPRVVVKDNKQTLKEGRDYYIQGTAGYDSPGTYLLTLIGTGNYTGSRQVKYTISTNSLISKAKVSKIPAQTYTGREITPAVTVKHNDRILLENEDYLVTYENNIKVGTATVIIKGIHDYSGQKKITFQIEGIPIRTMCVGGIKDMQYDGKIKVQSELTVMTPSGDSLTEGVDYSVSYKNNENAGTASVIITGINQYAGTVRKNFKIAKYDILSDPKDLIRIEDIDKKVPYEKGGVRPELAVYFDGKLLEKNKDYSLSYSKNNAVTSVSSPAVISISGKGNFTGKISKNFQIIESKLTENVTMTVADKAYVEKKGNYKSEPVLTDVNGKKLTRGKDYAKEYQYFLVNADGTETHLGEDVTVKSGSVIKIYVEGKGNYSGTLSATYRITPASFAKVKVKIAPKEFTGRPVTLNKSDITVKDGTTLLKGSDYEIVSYKNNVKAGTATVVLRGVGDYGGMKTVKFRIGRKYLLWWWK